MNPSDQPFPQHVGNTPPSGGGGAREALNVPGILLIVFGSLSLVLALFSLVSGGDLNSEQMSKMLSDPNLPPQARELIIKLAGGGARLMALFGAAIAGLTIFGGLQMRALKNYGFAVAASIVAMLPCTNCCCITLPVGIWALTILMKPEVKASFS